MTPRRRAWAKSRSTLRAAELLCAGAGCVCLVLYAAACARTSWFQAEQRDAFERARLARLEPEPPDQSEWSPARIARYASHHDEAERALARLDIPAADVSVMVLDGTEEATLDRAVGHIKGTALPGEAGNLGIAGHRDGFFRGLRHLEEGDAIRLTTLDGTAHYQVTAIWIVDPDRVDVLEPTDSPVLTLVTCYPFYFVGDAPKRYVVRARRVGYEAWPSAAPELALARP